MSGRRRPPVPRCAGQADQLSGRRQLARGLRRGLVPAELAAVPAPGMGRRRPASTDRRPQGRRAPQNAGFRAGLAERGHAYVVGLRGDITIQPHDAHPDAPAWSGNGRPPLTRYRQPPESVANLAAAAGRDAFKEVTWREGSWGPRPRGSSRCGSGGSGYARVGRPRQPRWPGTASGTVSCPTCGCRPSGPTARTHRPGSGTSAGTSSTTTANSTTTWAWTASKAAPGTAGTTSPPSSPPPTPSSPNSAWPSMTTPRSRQT